MLDDTNPAGGGIGPVTPATLVRLLLAGLPVAAAIAIAFSVLSGPSLAAVLALAAAAVYAYRSR